MNSTYLQDLLSHFQSFVQARAVRPEDVHVRFSLADGSTYVMRGLRIVPPGTASGFGLIEDAAQQVNSLIVREQHILKVELALDPHEPRPIGLHTEAEEGGPH
jgi:hypothetical protein